jgi:hypothetical protein
VGAKSLTTAATANPALATAQALGLPVLGLGGLPLLGPIVGPVVDVVSSTTVVVTGAAAILFGALSGRHRLTVLCHRFPVRRTGIRLLRHLLSGAVAR